MSWELRADPGRAPGKRNIEQRTKGNSIWPSIAVVAAAAAFGGVIWFAYQNGRDANRPGQPPLVKADPNPVKVKPDNPGGQEIPFQDSTVYDRLTPNGQKPVMEKLLPPPEQPVTRPQPEAAPPPPPATETAAAAPPVQQPPALPSQQLPAPPIQQSTPALGPDDGSPTVLAPTAGIIVAPPPAARPAPAQLPKPATAQSPKPAPPPAETAAAPPKAAADPIAALIASQSGTVPAAAKSAGGGYRLQLSAVRTEDEVEPEWARLKRRYPELASLRSSSSKIDVAGKGTFYRVEAGPLGETEAKATCANLRTQGLGCIVVKP